MISSRSFGGSFTSLERIDLYVNLVFERNHSITFQRIRNKDSTTRAGYKRQVAFEDMNEDVMFNFEENNSEQAGIPNEESYHLEDNDAFRKSTSSSSPLPIPENVISGLLGKRVASQRDSPTFLHVQLRSGGSYWAGDQSTPDNSTMSTSVPFKTDIPRSIARSKNKSDMGVKVEAAKWFSAPNRSQLPSCSCSSLEVCAHCSSAHIRGNMIVQEYEWTTATPPSSLSSSSTCRQGVDRMSPNWISVESASSVMLSMQAAPTFIHSSMLDHSSPYSSSPSRPGSFTGRITRAGQDIFSEVELQLAQLSLREF
jgi:hypothetical protein